MWRGAGGRLIRQRVRRACTSRLAARAALPPLLGAPPAPASVTLPPAFRAPVPTPLVPPEFPALPAAALGAPRDAVPHSSASDGARSSSTLAESTAPVSRLFPPARRRFARRRRTVTGRPRRSRPRSCTQRRVHRAIVGRIDPRRTLRMGMPRRDVGAAAPMDGSKKH
jgi:hypothetical protein